MTYIHVNVIVYTVKKERAHEAQGCKNMIYRLKVIYFDGDIEEADYNTREEAEESAKGFKMAFGNQISWCGIIEKHL